MNPDDFKRIFEEKRASGNQTWNHILDERFATMVLKRVLSKMQEIVFESGMYMSSFRFTREDLSKFLDPLEYAFLRDSRATFDKWEDITEEVMTAEIVERLSGGSSITPGASFVWTVDKALDGVIVLVVGI